VMDELTNLGKGFNYGLDVTFEKYMTAGFYFMFTGSLYNARYKAADGVWRNTRFNRNFLLNALAGKEWMVGKTKRNMWSLNLKLTYMGGDRFSPVDYENSILNQEVVFDETKAYSSRLSPILVGSFTVSYRINRKKLSHELAFKMLNCTGYAEYFNHAFNYKTQKVDIIRDGIAMPNIYYKIEF
ncbi:MAG: prevent-host-death protein, partial [Muribaculaceae bacterium]|nr:prevent-host-death protein [Muribaculaceae bacterium]